MSQLPFAPPLVAFNRIYEPEISNALLSLLASGVAFSIVVRALCRADRVRDKVRAGRWVKGICLSERTQLHIVTIDCQMHLSLYPSYLCKSCAIALRSFTYSSRFIGWWTRRSGAKNFTGRLNTMLFLPRSCKSRKFDFIVTDVFCINGYTIKRKRFSAQCITNFQRNRLTRHRKVELVSFPRKESAFSSRDPTDRDSSHTMILRGLSLLWGTVSPWTARDIRQAKSRFRSCQVLSVPLPVATDDGRNR